MKKPPRSVPERPFSFGQTACPTTAPRNPIVVTIGGATGNWVIRTDFSAVVSEISIAAVNASVAEGAGAKFRVTASSPAPADLTVNLTISATGDYGAPTGAQTVTIPANRTTATHTVATAGDSVDEPDGSVTANAATVAVTDKERTVGVVGFLSELFESDELSSVTYIMVLNS